ncbi:MAG: polyprenyl synthetase family protein [Fimbriiglobus sp.]
MSEALWDILKPRVQAFEEALRGILAPRLEDVPPRLADAIRYSLLAPGKRLRPLLVMLACEATGGQFEAAYPAAAALEMIHTYSLIHDDLPAMDDDDLRRGLPTCHKQFDEATAILAGDALLTMAFEVLARSYSPSLAAVSIAELASGAGAVGMVGGQMLDLLAEDYGPNAPEATVEQLENIHRRKTGALFRSSLLLGAMVAHNGPIPAVVGQHLTTYAAAFGLAFQVTDDLLDVESSSEKTGKRVGKDAQLGKLTYPGFLGIEASRARAVSLGQEAELAAEQLGPGAKLLGDLARFVVQRDR